MSQLANPKELLAAAARIERGAAELERIQKRVRQAMERTEWIGGAGDSLRQEILRIQRQVDTAQKELQAMVTLLRGGADAVAAQRDHHRGKEVGFVVEKGKPLIEDIGQSALVGQGALVGVTTGGAAIAPPPNLEPKPKPAPADPPPAQFNDPKWVPNAITWDDPALRHFDDPQVLSDGTAWVPTPLPKTP
jgi:uncharacterized protein YukE